jgi:predicted enzyme related to lactoylglutathione lyase
MKNLGVEFTMEPTNMGMSTVAVLNDTCGNLIQIYQLNA